MATAPVQTDSNEWESFYGWISAICTVTFDLELGQVIEYVFPESTVLTERERSNICYLSFPDSNSGFVGDTQFQFRLRRTSSHRLCRVHHLYNRNCAQALQADAEHYYGFVYFRQTKDTSIQRGYLQKSVVVLTQLPFDRLYTYVATAIAQQFFAANCASSVVEAVGHNIRQWPSLAAGHVHSLPLLGDVLRIYVPNKADKSFCLLKDLTLRNHENAFPQPVILSAVTDLNIYERFYSMLPYLHFLWELVLLGEPIVVMAPTPVLCSEFVNCLVSIIWPLRFAGDYRPFFTIHDSEFKEYTSSSGAPHGVIIGVTNPFFAKALHCWPHVIRVTASGVVDNGSGVMEIQSSNASPSSNAKSKIRSAKNGMSMLDGKPGIYSKYTPLLAKDKAFMKRLFKGIQTKRPVEAQNALIRKYFLELTQSFVLPLERYITSLMPLQRNVHPLRARPVLREFDADEFAATLPEYGPQFSTGIKGEWGTLYRKFFDTDNFMVWYEARTAEVNAKLEQLHLEAICHSDIAGMMGDKSEVEIAAALLQLEDKRKFIRNSATTVSHDVQSNLRAHINSLRAMLPEESRGTLEEDNF